MAAGLAPIASASSAAVIPSSSSRTSRVNRTRAAIRGKPRSAKVIAIRSANAVAAVSDLAGPVRTTGHPIRSLREFHKLLKRMYRVVVDSATETTTTSDRRGTDQGGTDAVVVRGLVKTFGSTRALDGLDLVV